MKEKKIAVVMGGPSAEREVSLRTGQAILKALQAKGYQAIGLDLEPATFVATLQAEKIEMVFNAIHGLFGEDGALQGTLEMLGIPYTGSGLLASAMAMDKGVSKRMFVAAEIPTAKSRILTTASMMEADYAQLINEFSLPVVVKAASQGSSIGVVIVETAEALPAAIQEAFRYSEHVLVEQFIVGREVTIAVWGGNNEMTALPVIEIVPHSGRYDYHSKYTSGATDYIVPAPLSEELTLRLQDVAKRTFTALGCAGIARVDIMIDQAEHLYVLEVNTIPGMTETSLVPKAAAAAGISFGDLCEKLLLLADQ